MIRSFGCEPSFKGYQGYPASICVSINEEVVHGIPRADRIIEAVSYTHLDVYKRQQLVEAKKELFNLRFQNATNQLDNTSRIKEVRRNIARIQTVIAEKTNAAN